jgi:hypothetical protein
MLLASSRERIERKCDILLALESIDRDESGGRTVVSPPISPLLHQCFEMRYSPNQPRIFLLSDHSLPICMHIHSRIHDPRSSAHASKRLLKDVAREHGIDQDLVRLSRRRFLEVIDR